MILPAQICKPVASTAEVHQIRGAHDPCTHVANAQRIVKHFGDQLLYVQGIGWHVWGPPWREGTLEAQKIIQALGQKIAEEAATMANWVAEASGKSERDERQSEMEKRFRWASRSEDRANLLASLDLAAPHLAIPAENLDADPHLVGLPGGVLDLRTGEHREHRRDDRITRVLGCDYDASATATVWNDFLNDIMGGDGRLIDYLQRMAGYVLMGARTEHLLPILWGGGANGKSVFVGTLQSLMGEYATSGSPDLLIKKPGTDHPTALADLQGRRLVVVSETGEGGRLNEERAKLLTGGDRITARRMRQDFYEFAPTHQLIVQTNHRPIARGTDEGLWRRLRLIPFNVTIPPEKRDTALPAKIKAELPGVLNWALEGLRSYQGDGFQTPDAVTNATAGYRSESDQIGAFIEDCCIVTPGAVVTAKELYANYAEWCTDSGERPVSNRSFGLRLQERGLEQARTGSARKWRGIGLRSDAYDACDANSGLSPTRGTSSRDYTDFGRDASLPSHGCPRCGGEGCGFCSGRVMQ